MKISACSFLIQGISSLLFILLVIHPSKSFSQSPPQNRIVSSPSPLLSLPLEARASAMGHTGIGTTSRAADIIYNHAKTAFSEKRGGIAANYLPWLRQLTTGMYALHIAGYHQLGEGQSLTSSLRYFTWGDVEVSDYNNNLSQVQRPYEFSGDIGYARKLSERLSIGLAFRYLRSSITGTNDIQQYNAAHAFCGDVALYYNGINKTGKGLTAGFTVSNIGTRPGYQPNDDNKVFLPAKIGVGIGYTFVLDDKNKLMLASDFNKSLVPLVSSGVNGMDDYYNYSIIKGISKSLGNKAISSSLGAEYTYDDLLALRAGYFLASKSFGNRNMLCSGLGIHLKDLNIDFAYIVSSGSGSNALQFGVSLSIR